MSQGRTTTQFYYIGRWAVASSPGLSRVYAREEFFKSPTGPHVAEWREPDHSARAVEWAHSRDREEAGS